MVGVSEVTTSKQNEFRYLISAHLRIVKHILKKQWHSYQRYQYIDMYSGPGRYEYEDKEIIGSPIIFLEEVEKIGIDYDAYFIERDKESLARLKYFSELPFAKEKTPHIHYIYGDNREKMPLIKLPINAYGLVYADPNASCPHIEMLTQLFSEKREYDKIDLLINLGTTGIKWTSAGPCPRCSLYTEKGNYYHCLDNLKIYRSVRESLMGRWGFTWGAFANHPLITKRFKAQGFVDGPRAEDFFQKVLATKEYLADREYCYEHRYDKE